MKYLIVIDMQNDFLSGSLGIDKFETIIGNAVKEIATKCKEYKVVFTQDTHNQSYLSTREGKELPVVHCISQSWGWQICEELQPFAKDALIVEKDNFGYVKWSEILSEVEEIELIGVCTDICVVSNALILRAIFPDATISVKADCCGGVTDNLHNAALAVMSSCQIKVV